MMLEEAMVELLWSRPDPSRPPVRGLPRHPALWLSKRKREREQERESRKERRGERRDSGTYNRRCTTWATTSICRDSTTSSSSASCSS
jgi:hypothetical protein